MPSRHRADSQGSRAARQQNAVVHNSFLIPCAARDRRCRAEPGYNRTTTCQSVESTSPPWVT